MQAKLETTGTGSVTQPPTTPALPTLIPAATLQAAKVKLAAAAALRTVLHPCLPRRQLLLSVWGQEIKFSFVFIVCSFQLARLEDVAKRRTLLEDEHLSPKIE